MRPADLVLADAAVALGRALRADGLDCSVDEELLFVRALGELEVGNRAHVYWAASAVFLRRYEDVSIFDSIFDRFWSGLRLGVPVQLVAEHGETDPRLAGPQHGGSSLPQYRTDTGRSHLVDAEGARASSPLELPTTAGEEPGHGDRRGILAAYSPNEALTERDPLELDPEDLAAVRWLAEELRRATPRRRSRRLAGSRRGQLDVRRTVRRSLETDGEAVRPAYVAHTKAPRRMLFLCDVSGSMERYSRALLGSLHAAVGASTKTEAFVFATRLTRLTGSLSCHDIARGLDAARAAVPDWSGGTRIGHALADFRRTYGRLGLARGAIVVIASDGWDRGDPDLLASELSSLRLQCRRLVWLNPRPADLDGQPLAIGMRTALPYLDEYVAGHDPRAVAALTRLLRDLSSGRPERRQRVPTEGQRVR